MYQMKLESLPGVTTGLRAYGTWAEQYASRPFVVTKRSLLRSSSPCKRGILSNLVAYHGIQRACPVFNQLQVICERRRNSVQQCPVQAKIVLINPTNG